mmetsp:Transcript_4265/g.12254  ORF Transcript_4265/g.12254 Transcript_4265/m.12254 type:complete len:159 (-) Transcript_4265:334-810(-)
MGLQPRIAAQRAVERPSLCGGMEEERSAAPRSKWRAGSCACWTREDPARTGDQQRRHPSTSGPSNPNRATGVGCWPPATAACDWTPSRRSFGLDEDNKNKKNKNKLRDERIVRDLNKPDRTRRDGTELGIERKERTVENLLPDFAFGEIMHRLVPTYD